MAACNTGTFLKGSDAGQAVNEGDEAGESSAEETSLFYYRRRSLSPAPATS